METYVQRSRGRVVARLRCCIALAAGLLFMSTSMAPAQTAGLDDAGRARQAEPLSPETSLLRGVAGREDGMSERRRPDYDRGTIAADNSAIASGDGRPIDLGPQDQIRPIEPDLRGSADRDPFDNPPAGGDPGRFQIESVEPLKDRRTREFFEADPFAHLGWRLGPFILYQEVEAAPAWTSNVFYDRTGRGDWFADFRSETRLVSNWANHAIELRMLHDRSFHRTHTSENDEGATYEARGRLDVTRRTKLAGLVAREISQEARNSIDALGGPVGTGRADVVADRAALVLDHRFNRLSLQLRGGLDDTRYDDVRAIQTRDVTRRTIALRAQWEFRPTFSVFGEVAGDYRTFDSGGNGFDRDSRGQRFRAGVALGQSGEYLRGEFSAGYGRQQPDDGRLRVVEAFLVDANVAWRITPLTALLVEAETTIDDTTLAGSGGAVERRAGLKVNHKFTRRVTGEVGVSYATQDYSGASLAERETTFSARAEYVMNRHAALFALYKHQRYRSNEELRDYNASTVLLGVRLRN